VRPSCAGKRAYPRRISFWSSEILRSSEVLLLEPSSMETEGPLPAGRGLEWQSLLAEAHFADASDQGSATYSHMVDLFVERHHQLWKVRIDCVSGDPELLSHLCLSCNCSCPLTASWQTACIPLTSGAPLLRNSRRRSRTGCVTSAKASSLLGVTMGCRWQTGRQWSQMPSRRESRIATNTSAPRTLATALL
jgi:hypothetical protein